LAIAGDVSNNAEVVGGKGGVAELFKAGATPDEHVVEPGGQSDRDETAHGRGIDWLGVGPLPRLLVARESVDASGIARVETDKTGADQVPILADVEAWDEVVIVDVAFRWGVPTFGNLTQVFFEVGDNVLETSNLGGVLRGTGLDGERETVDKLPKLLGRDVGVSVEGGEHRSRGQWHGVGN